jgi:hypothetical protein
MLFQTLPISQAATADNLTLLIAAVITSAPAWLAWRSARRAHKAVDEVKTSTDETKQALSDHIRNEA